MVQEGAVRRGEGAVRAWGPGPGHALNHTSALVPTWALGGDSPRRNRDGPGAGGVDGLAGHAQPVAQHLQRRHVLRLQLPVRLRAAVAQRSARGLGAGGWCCAGGVRVRAAHRAGGARVQERLQAAWGDEGSRAVRQLDRDAERDSKGDS
jgi:hypothetical protein